MNKLISNFYSSVVSCKNTCLECPGITNNHEEGILPRGFFTKCNPNEVDILIVGKNPGHILTQHEEAKFYQNSDNRVLAVSEFTESLFLGSNPTTFHKNINRYIRLFLNLSKNDSIFERVALTNLVKCQFEGNEQDRLKMKTIKQCYDKFLKEEIALLNPKIIIALGREVESFLQNQNIKIEIVYILHPSYYYSKKEEQEKLMSIKNHISFLLNNSND